MSFSEYLHWVFSQGIFVGLPTWRNFAHSCRMPAVSLITVGALNEDGTVTQALGKNLPANVIETHSPAWSEIQRSSSYGMTQAD